MSYAAVVAFALLPGLVGAIVALVLYVQRNSARAALKAKTIEHDQEKAQHAANVATLRTDLINSRRVVKTQAAQIQALEADVVAHVRNDPAGAALAAGMLDAALSGPDGAAADVPTPPAPAGRDRAR